MAFKFLSFIFCLIFNLFCSSITGSKYINKKKGEERKSKSNFKKLIKHNNYDTCQKLLEDLTEGSRELLLNTKIKYDDNSYYPVVIAAFEGNLPIVKLLDYFNPKKDILNNFLFQSMNLLHLSIFTDNYEMFCYLFYRKNVSLMKPTNCLVGFIKNPSKNSKVKSDIARNILDFIVYCKPGIYKITDIKFSINLSFKKLNLNTDLSHLVSSYVIGESNDSLYMDNKDVIDLVTVDELLRLCIGYDKNQKVEAYKELYNARFLFYFNDNFKIIRNNDLNLDNSPSASPRFENREFVFDNSIIYNSLKMHSSSS